MSDMSRHAQPSPAPAHDQHDPLLVAQFAAGDPLDPARAQEANAWLASCPDCAALASDLRRVSALVVSEPVPPRRRDFRLSPEQAEQLQGNTLTRFFRGLSLPRSRAFRPAAAGIMSVGLVFVVAGYAWPDETSVTVQTETAAVPAPIEQPAASAPAPALQFAPPTEGRDSAAPAADLAPERAAFEDAMEAFAADPELLEELAEHQSGTSARGEAMQKSLEAELDELAIDGDLGSEEAMAGMVTREVADLVDDAAEPDAVAKRMTNDVAALTAQADGAGVGETEVAAVAQADGDGIERWLIFVGAALAVGGGLLLLLAWFSRRSADTLLD